MEVDQSIRQEVLFLILEILFLSMTLELSLLLEALHLDPIDPELLLLESLFHQSSQHSRWNTMMSMAIGSSIHSSSPSHSILHDHLISVPWLSIHGVDDSHRVKSIRRQDT